jgi:hypothetical protein
VCAVDEGAEIDPELEEGAWNPVNEGKEDAVNEQKGLLTTKT